MKPPIAMHEAMRRNREAAGLSQRELAERAHTFQSVLWRYEKGLAQPTLYTALDLARVLGLTLEEYLGLREIPDK